MKFSSKRTISRLVAVTMLVSSVFSNVIVANADDAVVSNDAVESSTAAYIPAADAMPNKDEVVYSDDVMEIVAGQDLSGSAVETPADQELIAAAGKTYNTYITTSSANTSLEVDGAAASSYRIMFKVTAKQDATITFDSKLAKNGKVNIVLKDVVITGTDKNNNPAGTATSVATTGTSGTTDTFSTLTAEVKAGDVIYFAGKGTNAQLYAVNAVAAGGTTPVDPTPVDPTPVDPTPVDPTPVDPTPVDPTPAVGSSYIPAADALPNADTVVYSDDVMEIVAGQDLSGSAVETPADQELIAAAGKTYNTYITTSSANTSLEVDGAAASSYRIMFKVTAKQDATITFDSKLAKNGKENIVLKDVVITGTDKNNNPAGTATSIERTGASGTTDSFSTLTAEVKAGDVIYFAGKGTNAQLYAVNAVAAGGTTPVDPTPVDPTPVDPTPVDPTPVDPTPVDPTPVDPTPAEGSSYIPAADALPNADAVVYSDDVMEIVAGQDLSGSAVETPADQELIAAAGKTYNTYITTSSVNTSLEVDGAAASSYRIMFKVTAKQDATITFDSKLAKNGKENIILKDVVITGTSEAGAPSGTAASVARTGASGTTDSFSTLTAEVKAGDVIYFAGKGTNAQLYAVNAVAAGGTTPVDPTPVVGENDVEINVVATYDPVANTVVAQYVLSGNAETKGFNNYTVKLVYDKAVLAPVSVAQGDITMQAMDALGNMVDINGSKALDVIVDDTVAFCIFDDGNAAPGSLPEFTGNGVLFTVTYNVIGTGSTAVGAEFTTINTVSSDDTIVSKLNAVVTEGTVEVAGGSGPDEPVTEQTTAVAPYIGHKEVSASSILDFFAAAGGRRQVSKNSPLDQGTPVEEGIGTYNRMSAWTVKTSTSGFKFTDGKVYEEGFQLGNGNEDMDIGLAVGANAFAGKEAVMSTTLEKALIINAGAPGVATLYATISNSELNEATLYLLDLDGNVVDVQKAEKTLDGNGEVIANSGNPIAFNVPAAGEYYIICPGKQTGLNVMAIDLNFSNDPITTTTTTTVSEPTTSTTTATTSAPTTSSEPTTSAPTTSSEPTTSATVSTTTYARRTGGGGGGSSVNIKTTTTTEAATEATSVESKDTTTKPSVITKDVEVTIGIEGVKIGGTDYTVDVAPYIQAASNSTLVPLRVVSLAILGGDVTAADSSNAIKWDGATKTATIFAGDSVIAFTAGSEIMVVDGKNMVMDNGVKAEIVDSRMYVPFRALGKALGVEVAWDADTKTAKYIAPTEATTEAVTEETTEAVSEDASEETTAEDAEETTVSEDASETTTAEADVETTTAAE